MRNRAAAVRDWESPRGLRLELLRVPGAAGLWVARRPLSRGAWRAFARATGRPEPPRSWWPWAEGEDDPVRGVTWADAAALCAWAGLSLPTEAELARARESLRPTRPAAAVPTLPLAGAAFPYAAAAAALAPAPGLVLVDGLREWCQDGYSGRVQVGVPPRDLGLRPALREGPA